MTDFRRPDLDLWEEEDDGEDQRPTIVSERPPAPAGLPPLARMSLVQRLIAKGELEDNEELWRAFAAQREGASAEAEPRSAGPGARAARSASVPSPIETAARQAADGRDSTEILDDRELDLLRLSEPLLAQLERAAAAVDTATPLSAPLPQVARPGRSPAKARAQDHPPIGARAGRAPAEPELQVAEETHEALLVRSKTQPGGRRPQAGDALASEATEVRPPGALDDPGPLRREQSALHRMDEVADDTQLRRHPQLSEEDFVPTRMARAPRTPAVPARRVPPEIVDTALFRDREITERVSIPPLASSLAPAARTVRPHLRPQGGLGGWQLALVAVLLIGAGLGVARLRRESAAAALTARVRSAVSAALEPSSAADIAAQPEPPAAEPAAAEPAAAESAPAPSSAAAEGPSEGSEAVADDPAPELAQAVAEAERAQRRTRAAQDPAGRSRAAGPRAEPPASTAEAPSALAAAPAPTTAREPAAAPREGPRAARPDAPSAQDLPAQPSRDEVRAALDAVIPELQKCTGALHGTADVTMTVRSAGVVSYAVVAGTFAGTPEGSCIARTVKLAKFPAFSEPSVRVSYPFEL